MVDKNDVAAVLELIRPSLQADGGDVQLVDVNDEGVVTVELQGACKGCPMSQMTLAHGVERILKERRARRRDVRRRMHDGAALLGEARMRRGDAVALPAQHPGRALSRRLPLRRLPAADA